MFLDYAQFGSLWTHREVWCKRHFKDGGQTWSLIKDMRRNAVARIEADRVEACTESTVCHGLRLALTDVKTYVSTTVPSYGLFSLIM